MISTKSSIVNALIFPIFGGHQRMMQRIVDEYVAKQSQLNKDPYVWAFFYGDRLFCSSIVENYNPKSPSVTLHKSLVQEFEVEISAWDYQGSTDYILIRHLFISTLNRTTNIQDLKTVFPEALHSVLSEHKGLLTEENPNPEGVILLKEKAEKLYPAILQNMALSLIVE